MNQPSARTITTAPAETRSILFQGISADAVLVIVWVGNKEFVPATVNRTKTHLSLGLEHSRIGRAGSRPLNSQGITGGIRSLNRKRRIGIATGRRNMP